MKTHKEAKAVLRVRSKSMIDGVTMGMAAGKELDMATEARSSMELPVTELEYRALTRAVSKYVTERHGDPTSLEATVSLEDLGYTGIDGAELKPLMLSLRRDKHSKNHYLNLSGNPLTFFTGQNQYGTDDIGRTLVSAYLAALRIVDPERTLPKSLRRKIKELDFNIHSIEFATYTRPLKDKRWLVEALHKLYAAAAVPHEGKMLCSQFLECYPVSLQDTEGSLRLKLYRRHGARKVNDISILLYDKEQLEEVHAELKSRLRIDLMFNQDWFTCNPSLRKASNLVDHVNSVGGWPVFIHRYARKALERSGMVYLLTFPAQPFLDYVGDFNDVLELPGLDKRLSVGMHLEILHIRNSLVMNTDTRGKYLQSIYTDTDSARALVEEQHRRLRKEIKRAPQILDKDVASLLWSDLDSKD